MLANLWVHSVAVQASVALPCLLTNPTGYKPYGLLSFAEQASTHSFACKSRCCLLSFAEQATPQVPSVANLRFACTASLYKTVGFVRSLAQPTAVQLRSACKSSICSKSYAFVTRRFANRTTCTAKLCNGSKPLTKPMHSLRPAQLR